MTTRLTTLLHDNIVDRVATAITAGTWALDLPAENVRHPFLDKVARTGTSAATEALVFDVGSAVAAAAVVIDAHTLTPGDSAIKIQGNATDSWGAPSFSENITYAADRILHYFASTQTFRYWRVVFTKSAAGETRDIGRVFIGPALELDEEPDFEDVQFDYKNPSEKSLTVDAHVYVNDRDDYYTIKFNFPGAYKSVFDAVNTAYRALRLARPFYLNLFPDLSDEIHYVVFSGEPSYKTKAWDPVNGDFIVAMKFEVEEFK